MGAPFKMKGSTFYGHGNQSPLKDDPSQEELDRRVEEYQQRGSEEQSSPGISGQELGISIAGDLLKLGLSQIGKPKPKFASKMKGFTSMTFGKNRSGKGSATELT